MRRKYKKVKIYRMSGRPVQLQNLVEFQEAWRKKYDELYDLYGKDMKVLTVKLDEAEVELHKIYPCLEEWDWETSQRGWKYLTKKYGPIAIATSERGQLIYIIMDQM